MKTILEESFERIQRRIRPLLIATLALLACGGCHQEAQDEDFIRISGSSYSLKPAGQSVPIDLTGVELVACSDQEREQIAHCLGRISATNLDIRKIVVAWAEKPMVARVSIGPDWYIYLARQTNGTWQFDGWSGYDLTTTTNRVMTK